MKKSTLVRNDKPHAVKMAEGANVAQRKNTKKPTSPEAPAPAPNNIQKITPVKVVKVAALAPPPGLSKPVRAKARLQTDAAPPHVSQAAKPKTVAKPRAKAPSAPFTEPPTAPSTAAHTAAPSEPVWEQDNPIKGRIEKLKSRNAQLAEQIERLQNTPTARGQRP